MADSIVVQLGRETELCLFEILNLAFHNGLEVAGTWDGFVSLCVGDAGAESIRPFLEKTGGAVRGIQRLGRWSDLSEPETFRSVVSIPGGPWAVSSLSPNLSDYRGKVRNLLRKEPADRGQSTKEIRTSPGEDELPPAKVFDLDLPGRGLELCLWRDAEGEVCLGKTFWVYCPEGFVERDFGKPHRPRRRGLMPPKLARQMVNLATTGEEQTVLDPFCGAGTVLIEALDRGMRVMGTDNRDDAISQARKNLEWYFRNRNTDSRNRLLFLERVDVRQLTGKIRPLSLDAVVGEGDLGPPIRGRLSRKAAVTHCADLEPLYVGAFAEIRTVLRPGGRVCLAVPFWQPAEGDPVFLNLARKLELMGYRPVFPGEAYNPLCYRRKDQKVGRAIHLLESPE